MISRRPSSWSPRASIAAPGRGSAPARLSSERARGRARVGLAARRRSAPARLSSERARGRARVGLAQLAQHAGAELLLAFLPPLDGLEPLGLAGPRRTVH